MTIKKSYLLIGAVAILVVGFVAGSLGASKANLGATSFDNQYFGGSVYQGLAQTLMFSGGNFVGPVNSSQTATFSGVTTLSGATTISGTAAISQTSSSTLKIGNNASGLGAGCLVLGDSAGATSTPVYITATGSTVTASTTKPAICK